MTKAINYTQLSTEVQATMVYKYGLGWSFVTEDEQDIILSLLPVINYRKAMKVVVCKVQGITRLLQLTTGTQVLIRDASNPADVTNLLHVLERKLRLAEVEIVGFGGGGLLVSFTPESVRITINRKCLLHITIHAINSGFSIRTPVGRYYVETDFGMLDPGLKSMAESIVWSHQPFSVKRKR